MSRNWAICIGINGYYNLQSLHYAKQDAESMRDFFISEGRFEQVYYFADDSPTIETPRGPMRSDPTFANLKRFFRERFQQPFLNVGDNFWFFFAGHGELHEGHDYLMPLDVDPGNLEETALRISDITAHLRNCGADNTVLLLDACRSQGSRRGLGLGTEEQQGMVTVYSCSPREASYEIEELGHGAFTYALLEGFKLQGGNNCATVERLDQYLRYQVPSLNAQHRKPVQTPYTAVEPLSKNHLILLPQKATLQDVQALKIDAQKAELEGDFAFAQQLWVRVLAASGVDQDAIAAFGRIAVKQAQQTASPGPAAAPTAGSRSVRDSDPRFLEETGDLVAESTPPPTFEFEVVTVDAKGKIAGREQRQVEYRREELDNGITLDLVLVPSGTFTMGSPNSEEGRNWYGEWADNLKGVNVESQHKVTVQPFLMGKYPVTQAQWKAVATLPKVERDLEADPANFKGDNRPVEQVSWDDAIEFCQRLSKHTGREYRLPSESEWEYACRAKTTTLFSFGETITTDLVNYDGNYTYGSSPKGQYREQTTEVGSFPPNAFGLYDMHGNVWDWCADHWHDSYQGAPSDGSAWTTGGDDSRRVLRGGSWHAYPGYCRSAFRNGDARDFQSDIIGFRIVCASSWAL
jgi:formylglycine-generating enzyme required for sulfatase activity/uncharacterized caspase-like protein